MSPRARDRTTLPAVVMGAAGAAALVASTVLQNPLGRLLSYRYRISGSWVDPQVQKIGQSPEEPAPRPSEGLRP